MKNEPTFLYCFESKQYCCTDVDSVVKMQQKKKIVCEGKSEAKCYKHRTVMQLCLDQM
jgi:hypothetical protein